MAKCSVCGKNEPVMKVICSECADRTCASCRYKVYIDSLDLLLCRHFGGMSGSLKATDYCSRYKEKE